MNNQPPEIFSQEEIAERIAAGKIQSTDLAWTDGMESWTPAGEVFPESFSIRVAAQPSHLQVIPPPLAPASTTKLARPDTHLVWAILATCLCCLPLGIASIVFSAQVYSRWACGDHVGAIESARKAKNFAVLAAILGGLPILGYLFFFAFMCIAGAA